MFDGFWTELVAMYVTLFYDGETPVAYNNATLKAVYFTDGPAIKTIPSGIINETYNLKAVAEDTSNVLFLSEPVYIQASDDLGSSGNGQLKVEAHYRLHPIIQ